MIEYTKAMRKAAGPKHEIAIHGQGRLPTAEALQYMRGVEECNLMWVEEPIQMDESKTGCICARTRARRLRRASG